jgi:tRNA threonylcarbamoyladenosine biosynthesis protein TsaE
MGESKLIGELDAEPEFAALAGAFARALHEARAWPLLVGLRGDLGSGKTTWARAMLRGLGYRGRVPSPTYTLLEQYACDGVSVVHLDLYRLRGDEELENLGLRDWLAKSDCWLLVEWPERAPRLAERCDLTLDFAVTAASGRRVAAGARSRLGVEASKLLREAAVNNKS